MSFFTRSLMTKNIKRAAFATFVSFASAASFNSHANESVPASTPDATTDLTAEQIIKKAELAAYYAGEDGKSEARMMIVDDQGRRQTRQFTILKKDVEDGGDQKMMVFFSRPADVSGMVFRVEKHNALNQDDDRWLYLPGLDLVKRISAGDKRTSFVGSHFFYEDVSGRSTALDSFELLSQTKDEFVLKGTPKDPSQVEFSHYDVRINKTTFIPMVIDFYNTKGEVYRKVESLNVEIIDGFPTVTKSKISDLEKGGYTLMQFRGIRYDLGMPDTVFTERSLRTPPLEWLRR